MGKFESLRVWQIGRELNRQVLAMTLAKDFRARHHIVNQLERAALACSNNVAEGYARNTAAQLRQQFNVAIASAAEVQNLMYALCDSGQCSSEQFRLIYDLAASFQKLAKAFIRADRQGAGLAPK